ncbi:MAG: hypothetical protein AB7G11_05065 [Phycisphaerales bacterium]
MTSESSQLLKMLGSGVRAGPCSTTPAPANIDSAPFAELLKQAESGDLATHRRVCVESSAGIELTEAQSLALSAAADRAEAAGIRKALVMLDDQAFVLDVSTRSITGKAQFNQGVLSGIDGVMKISSTTQGGAAPGATDAILPLPRVSPSQLLNLPTRAA